MNDPSRMLKQTYGQWLPQHPVPLALTAVGGAEEPVDFQNSRSAFALTGSKTGRTNWKSKKAAGKRKKGKSAAGVVAGAPPGVMCGGSTVFSGYKPPTLNDLQYQNRLKARRFYPKKKFSRFAPFAPRNTTSFIIRAKKSGGIASLISPSPVTPAILPTPIFSPSREMLVDMAKEEWGVDGYGSMKGLIRLRSPTMCGSAGGVTEEEDVDDESSESDVEEHVEVERRLDHDLSRFEIVYPSIGEEQGGPSTAGYLLENRVDDQDAHITQLEEENLTLKERLFLIEGEMRDLRMRLQMLETDCRLPDGTVIQINNKNDDDNDDDGKYNNLNSTEANSENDVGGEVCSEKNVEDCKESDDGNLIMEWLVWVLAGLMAH